MRGGGDNAGGGVRGCRSSGRKGTAAIQRVGARDGRERAAGESTPLPAVGRQNTPPCAKGDDGGREPRSEAAAEKNLDRLAGWGA